MAMIDVRPIAEGLSFGARISGVDRNTIEDPAVQQQIKRLFEARGLLVFEGVEPSDAMLVKVSSPIGPLQDISLKEVSRVDADTMPGVLKFNNDPSDANVFEIDGEEISGWIGWHFDSCYNKVLCRGGALRVVINPPAGGRTGFADGIQLYKAISPELRERFRELKVLYHTNLMFDRQRFGLPKSFRPIRIQEETARLHAEVEETPRAMHPAIWRRDDGQYVLHAAPFQADGILGMEGPEGDALLESLFDEIYARMEPYWHDWKTTDIVVWDNWRFIHSAGGHAPEHQRLVHRTTINGDYGLGDVQAFPRPRRVEDAIAG